MRGIRVVDALLRRGRLTYRVEVDMDVLRKADAEMARKIEKARTRTTTRRTRRKPKERMGFQP